MKHSTHYLAAALLLAVHLSVAGDEPAITAFSLSDERAHLQWEGAAPPFEIESSTGLAGWKRVLQTMESSASAPAGDTAAFFRIRGEEPVGGVFLGQLRVDEGEFGKPLARHRLKSLWDFHLPADGTASSIPQVFFQQLTLRLVYREGDGLKTFTGTLAELPGAVVTTEARKMTVAWTFGKDDDKRDYVLELSFRYDIDTRQRTIHLSDPSYKLTCTYATSRPEAEYAGELTMVNTRVDSVSLYQLADQKPPAWLQRDARFRVDRVSFRFQYDLGIPMLEGSPAFIWKTPILDQWHGSTVSGLTSEPLVITDRFSQTYKPGHHNFVEDFWIEPALIPGLAAETLEELREANIRFIVATHPSAFPESPSTMKLVGFDLKVR
jgi:hypothetical protein